MAITRFDCQCSEKIENWIPEDPSSRHRWRVQCLQCDKFLKWGSDEEYRTRKARGDDIRTVQPPPPRTIDEFYD